MDKLIGFQQAYQTWQANDYHQWRVNKSVDTYKASAPPNDKVCCVAVCTHTIHEEKEDTTLKSLYIQDDVFPLLPKVSWYILMSIKKEISSCRTNNNQTTLPLKRATKFLVTLDKPSNRK